MKIKHVRQSDWKDRKPMRCGPACVAMVAGVSESSALLANFGTRSPGEPVFSWKDVRNALTKLGVAHDGQARKIRRLENLKWSSIIGCPDHYVVFEPKKRLVYDPILQSPVPLAKFKMKPVSYLAVYGRAKREENKGVRTRR
jgi:hypothetical protein